MPDGDKQKRTQGKENNENLQPVPFEHFLRSANDFFHYPPIKGFLQSIDEFFQFPFSMSAFRIDLQEDEEEYILSAELPGVEKEQIQIGIFRNKVVISIENREELTEVDETGGNYKKRITKKLDSRTISFTKPVLDHKAKASYKDGLLKIRIPIDKGKQLSIE